MSQKTFSTAPKPRQPTAEQIAAFEQGGAGHDDSALATSASVIKTTTGATKRLSLDLPASVHTRFKTACSANGRKMVSEIQDFIERRTAELEAEAGLSHK